MDRRPWIVGLLVMFVSLFGSAHASAATYDEWDWLGDDTTAGMEHWQWSTSGTGNYLGMNAECELPFASGCTSSSEYPSLLSYVNQDDPLSAGSKGEWKYEVPGGPDTYIKSAYFSWGYVTPPPLPSPADPHPYFELAGSGGTVSSFLPPMTLVERNYRTLTGGSGATEFRFGMRTPSALTTLPDKAAELAMAKIELGDDVDPVLDFDPGDVPNDWVKGTIQIPMEASDNGLGLAGVFAFSENPVLPEDPFAGLYDNECDGNSDNPCPAGTGPGFELDLDTAKVPDGVSELSLFAMDPLANHVIETFELKVDNGMPGADATGSFYAAPDGILTDPSYTLDIDFDDPHSGMASAELTIDNVVIDSDSQSCTVGGCGLGLTGSIDTDDYTNGMHDIEITATDIAGNVVNAEGQFEVDR